MLGSDCALDLNNINNICSNLARFFHYAHQQCDTKLRLRQLQTRCSNVMRIMQNMEN